MRRDLRRLLRSHRNGSAGTGALTTSPTGDPWHAFGYLVSGVAFYGLLGWLADRWLGTSFLVAIGIVLGAGLGVCMTWSRFRATARSDGTARTEERRDDTGEAVSLIPTLVPGAEEYVPPVRVTSTCRRSGPTRRSTFLGQEMYLGVTKPMLQLVLGAVLVFVFFRVASAKRAMVPGKLQYVGEMGYGFVRNSLGRDIIGSKDFMRFVPYLFALFFFVLLNNFFATHPVPAVPDLLARGPGLRAGADQLAGLQHRRHQGPGRAPRLPQAPDASRRASTGRCWPLLVPLEFISNILVRPLTLALRLFANMLAGHILLILFALGGEYLLLHGAGAGQAGRHRGLADVRR